MSSSFVGSQVSQMFSRSLIHRGGFVHGRAGLESRASSKYELQGSLDVPICGLQRPQHQLLILDPHVPELLQLGLPTPLATQKNVFRKNNLLFKHHLVYILYLIIPSDEMSPLLRL